MLRMSMFCVCTSTLPTKPPHANTNTAAAVSYDSSEAPVVKQPPHNAQPTNKSTCCGLFPFKTEYARAEHANNILLVTWSPLDQNASCTINSIRKRTHRSVRNKTNKPTPVCFSPQRASTREGGGGTVLATPLLAREGEQLRSFPRTVPLGVGRIA